MKKVINKKTYNTETSTLIAKNEYRPRDDEPDGYIWAFDEGLWLGRHGYFLAGKGGARTRWASRGGSGIIPLSELETGEWVDWHDDEMYEPIVSSYGDVEVDIYDSEGAGNDRSCTLAFRDRHFPDCNWATVRELFGVAIHVEDREYVYAACLAAIRRERDEYYADEEYE